MFSSPRIPSTPSMASGRLSSASVAFATVLVRPLADPAERLRRYVVAGSRRTLKVRGLLNPPVRTQTIPELPTNALFARARNMLDYSESPATPSLEDTTSTDTSPQMLSESSVHADVDMKPEWAKRLGAGQVSSCGVPSGAHPLPHWQSSAERAERARVSLVRTYSVFLDVSIGASQYRTHACEDRWQIKKARSFYCYAIPPLQFAGSTEASALPGASESEGQPGPLRG